MADIALDICDSIVLFAEKYNLTNSQEYLDFADELNELSVKY